MGLLMIATKGWADTIVFDTSTISNSAAVASPCTWSMTVGNGTAAGNKAAVLACSVAAGQPGPTAASIGGTAFVRKQRDIDGSGQVADIWVVAVGAMTGAQTISVTPGGGQCGGQTAVNTICTASTYAGVNQTTPVDVSTGAIAASATSISANVSTTNSGDMLVDAVEEAKSSSLLTIGGSQVTLSNIANATQGVSIGASYKGPLGAPASQTMSWSNAGTSTNWTLAWVALNANPSAGGINKMMRMEQCDN
jgi:hypothetical protein